MDSTPSIINLPIKTSWIRKLHKYCEIKINDLLIDCTSSTLKISGNDGFSNNFIMEGTLNRNGTFQLTKTFFSKNIDYKGQIFKNEGGFCFNCISETEEMIIWLQMDVWSGYYMNPHKTQIEIGLIITEDEVKGISLDSNGVAIWNGTLKDKFVQMNKRYLESIKIFYDGIYKVQSGIGEIHGKWFTNPFCSDEFKITHTEKEE